MVRQFFGYIRVSTAKQGQQGVSLQEQRDAILRYASRGEMEIILWFEEQETAAKRGRPGFTRMLKMLRQGKAHGVVLHKIDRGARNLKDWADIADLIDTGIEVHFANESIDMHSRGGRLSADIQAVVAADYIRNLREETRKGFYGRLKQGLYPLSAPVGYLDKGKGKAKEPDPMSAPLVRNAFELYSTVSVLLTPCSRNPSSDGSIGACHLAKFTVSASPRRNETGFYRTTAGASFHKRTSPLMPASV